MKRTLCIFIFFFSSLLVSAQYSKIYGEYEIEGTALQIKDNMENLSKPTSLSFIIINSKDSTISIRIDSYLLYLGSIMSISYNEENNEYRIESKNAMSNELKIFHINDSGPKYIFFVSRHVNCSDIFICNKL